MNHVSSLWRAILSMPWLASLVLAISPFPCPLTSRFYPSLYGEAGCDELPNQSKSNSREGLNNERILCSIEKISMAALRPTKEEQRT